ncbi:MAG: hypothetical protein EXR75_03295 [Myxococcales bacterium]|nr:hypothetical protein [Myxococcales bacterium]
MIVKKHLLAIFACSTIAGAPLPLHATEDAADKDVATESGAVESADHAAAQALFDEARALIAKRDFGRACPKLAESMRLDPQPGTQLNLASCYQEIGKTASAWTNYRDAEVRARRAGNEKRETIARERADALEPRLSRLVLLGPAASKRAPGLRILRDGTEVGVAIFGSALPIDPGEHRIAAEAPGKLPWSTKITVIEGAPTYHVKIPSLADAPIAAAPDPGLGVQRVVALVLGGAGAIGLGVGFGLGAAALSKNEESFSHCLPNDTNQCSAQGVVLREEALSAGNAATGLIVAGSALLTGGTITFFTAPSRASALEKSRTTWDFKLAPVLATGQVTATLRARW